MMRGSRGLVCFLWGCALAWPQGFNFHAGVTYPAQNGPVSAVKGDFNGDGKLDVAVGNAASSSVSVFLGKGDGTFGSASTVAVPGGCVVASLTAADINGDGKTDLVVVCSYQTTVWTLPGLGNGQFGTPIPTLLPAPALVGFSEGDFQLAAVADFTGDGRPDLVIGLGGGSSGFDTISLNLMKGNGDGTFQAPTVIIPSGTLLPTNMVAADFDGDGNQDLAVAEVDQNSLVSEIQIWRGNGKGSFQALAGNTIPILPLLGFLIETDVNGDGIPDLVVSGTPTGGSGASSSLLVFVGIGGGALKQTYSATETGFLFALMAADLRGTGKPDLIEVAGATDALTSGGSFGLAVRAGNGDGTFQSAEPVPFPANLEPWCNGVVSGDWNGDGSVDLAFASIPAGTIWGNHSNGGGIQDVIAAYQSLGPGGLVVILNALTPTPAIGYVVNGASFQPGIESGSWVTIGGMNLANTNPGRTWRPNEIVNGNLPMSLDGVSVTIDGKPAFVYYISPTQINVQAPTDAVTGPVAVVVHNNGQVSAPVMAQMQTYAPAFFLYSGTNYAITSHYPDYGLVGNPAVIPGTVAAKPGDVLILWGTGFGPTNPAQPAGVEVSGAPVAVTAPVITVGGAVASLIGVALSPGNAGLYQVAIQLPASLPSGALAVQASQGGVQSPTGVVIFAAGQ